ncbi:MAG: hypothetical protein JWN66_2613 [Sphingomonas bacterium]|uniref:helix-turn-helix transcriptional regulator n=1 Tax=Sphingomonas bacterium TaxID=1895847 RepID=UPI00262DD9D7|nr:LuxR family transcriptional regulator [Sphingomonas bacterium]MDB5705497.1 hypothetical protein [Sphingomonas bacterium]
MARENLIVAAFRRQAAGCRTLEDLGSLIAEAAPEAGFRFFALSRVTNNVAGEPRLHSIDNYPQSWTERVVARQLFLHDPVLEAGRTAIGGFPWSDLGRHVRLSAEQRLMLADASRAGLRNGFTVAAQIPFEPRATCTLATTRAAPIATWRAQTAELLGLEALRVARRLGGAPPCPRDLHFSRRETQVLDLLVAGKSYSVMADLLGISHNTVKVYAGAVLAKLGVADRTRAAVLAAAWGLAAFDPSIPPAG